MSVAEPSATSSGTQLPEVGFDVERARLVGVLNALRRPRTWYFLQSPAMLVVTALFSFGVWPLWVLLFRFDRFRRLEWNTLAEASRVIAHLEPGPSSAELVRYADDQAARSWPKFPAIVMLVIAALLGTWMGWRMLVDRTIRPNDFHLVMQLVPLLLAAFSTQMFIVMHRASTKAWRAMLNTHLVELEHRPLRWPSQKPRGQSLLLMAILIVLAVWLDAWWTSAAIMAPLLARDYIVGTYERVRRPIAEAIIEMARLTPEQTPPDPEHKDESISHP